MLMIDHPPDAYVCDQEVCAIFPFVHATLFMAVLFRGTFKFYYRDQAYVVLCTLCDAFYRTLLKGPSSQIDQTPVMFSR